MPNSLIYTDASATATGSVLNSANLNTAVPASPYLIAGGIPGSVSGSSLQISQPLTQAVVPSSSTVVQYLQVAAQTLTVPSSPTGVWYVDLTSSGAYSVNQLSVPATTNLRLYQVTSSGTGLSLLVQLASGAPLAPSQVQVDITEAATADTLLATSSQQNNFNRIRYMLGMVIGGAGSAWNAAVQMIPLAQKGAASGVASLDANTHVVQKPAKGIRDYQSSTIGFIDVNLNYNNGPRVAVPSLGGVTITADSGSVITFSVTGTMSNGTGNIIAFRWALRLDNTATYINMGMFASDEPDANFCHRVSYTPPDTSAHTYTLYYDNAGSAATWTAGQVGIMNNSNPQNCALLLEAMEHN